MKEHPDCRQFQDLLDRTLDGPLGEQLGAWMETHAAACTHCEALQTLRLATAAPPLEELEAQVPDDLADGLWPRVSAGLNASGGDGSGGIAGSPRVLRALAAGVAVLLAGTLLLSALLMETRGRVAELRQELERQNGDSASAFTESNPAPGEPNMTARMTLVRFTRESWTREELLIQLERFPKEATVLDPREARSLVRIAGGWMGTAGMLPLDCVDPVDGLQVAEAIRCVEEMPVPDDSRALQNRLRRILGGNTL